MAQLKQLSAGSSQIIMMMFRDKNNAPIKADSVHVKGSIFTGSGKPFEFEVNKGVCTNCKIQNDMLLFNIVPLLGLGQMQVYTQTFLGDAKAITGTYISENQQKLGVEVVQKGTFLSDRQGAMWVDVYLPIEINEAAQIPWVPAGANEQWIRDYLDKYVKTPAFAALLSNMAIADNKLSNVSDDDFKKKGETAGMVLDDLSNLNPDVLKQKSFDAGMMGKDLGGVVLEKLKEACFQAGMMGKDLGGIELDKLKEILLGLGMLQSDLANISITDLSRVIMQTKAYKNLAEKKDIPVADVEKTIHYVENQKPIDFATIPHDFIHAVFQFTKPKQTITQVMPDADLGKTIIIETIQMTSDCRLVLKPAKGQFISGSPKTVEIVYNGVQGIAYPDTAGNYDWIPEERSTSEAIPVQDENGNIIVAKSGFKFVGAQVSKTANNEALIEISPSEYSNQGGGDGTPAKSVTAEFPLMFSPAAGNKAVNLRIKRGYLQKAFPDAYYAALTRPITIQAETNKLHKGNIWFDDVIYNHGAFISTDNVNKAYGIEEDDAADPNVSGGTLAFVIVRLAFRGNAPDNGNLVLELTDPKTGLPLQYMNDKKASIRRDYTKGEQLGVIQMAFPFEAKGQQIFQVEVKHNFNDDTIILEDRINGNSCILISYVHPENQINPAVAQFEQDTNQRFLFQKNYFGADLFDMAYLVQKNVGEKVINPGTGGTMMDGAHFYNNTVMSTEVTDGVVKFIGDAPNNSFFTFGYIFHTEETIPMRKKIIKVDINVKEPTTPAEISLYSWIGEPDKYDTRIYGDIVNDKPVLVSGWTVVGSRDLLPNYQSFGMTFEVPSNSNNFAVCIHPKEVTNVTEINLTDFKISAQQPFYDVQFIGINEISEKYQINNTRKAVFGVDNSGYASLRYSVGIGETKMPVGWLIPSASDTFPPVKLNQKWKDNVGHKGEGVLEVTRDFRCKNLYAILRISGSDEKKLAPDSIQTVQVYFGKEDGTGINPIEQTRTSFQSKTAEAPKYISTNKGDAFQPMEFKKGDFIWLYAICNYNDGAYFMSVKNGQYLIQTIIEWEEIEESPVVPLGGVDGLRLMQAGKEVDKSLYNIEIDVDTNAIKVIKK